jgi:hypothetical protein
MFLSCISRCKKRIQFCFCVLLWVLVACSGEQITPGKAYKWVVNLDPPQSIRQLQGTYSEIPFVQAYFTYEAEQQYFVLLENHVQFLEEHEFNERIHRTDCKSSGMPDDFSYWTDGAIDVLGKECFTGVIFPYNHYILYNPITNETHHFVTEMRD